MKNFVLLLLLSLSLLSCKKNNEGVAPNLKEKIIGRWEAVEFAYTKPNGEKGIITFGENGDFPAEYSIGLNYSSGFELRANGTLDAIWYGRNKNELYPWELVNNKLVIKDGELAKFENGALEFKVIDVNETFLYLDFDDGKSSYKMAKLK